MHRLSTPKVHCAVASSRVSKLPRSQHSKLGSAYASLRGQSRPMDLRGGRSKGRAAAAGAPSNRKKASSGFRPSRGNESVCASAAWGTELFVIKQLNAPPPCLSLGIVPPGRQNAYFATSQNHG